MHRLLRSSVGYGDSLRGIASWGACPLFACPLFDHALRVVRAATIHLCAGGHGIHEMVEVDFFRKRSTLYDARQCKPKRTVWN